MTAGEAKPQGMKGRIDHERVALSSADGVVTMTFDLSGVTMTREQRETVAKLFCQDPVAEVTVDEHRHDLERGQEGPASQYLTREEFESIRELGVRLGTAGDLVATACDFCLHCVKLEALPEWNRGIGP